MRKENLKKIRLTGARVLTSDEAMWPVQEREDQKKQKLLDLEKWKAEREEKCKEKPSKERGKTKSKKTNTVIKEKDSEERPICKMKWKDDTDKDSQWVWCKCKQWLHEGCIDYDIPYPDEHNPLLCPDCINYQWC